MPGVLPLVVVSSQEGCVDAPIDVDGDGWPDQIDCDDSNGDIHEATPEVCNEKDDNCDGFVDEGVNFTYYLDADGDTYGTAATSIFSCEPAAPDGYTDNALDYDDLDESVNILTWYEDGDGDGYGNAESFVTSEETGSFEMPEGYVENDDDCDDTDYDANIDQEWYADADADGYGNAGATKLACDQPEGYVDNDLDDDDADDTVYPGAPEICDGKDNDGNGLTDDEDSDLDTSTASSWYADSDGDGYGDTGTTQLACDQPLGYVSNDLDDDDADDTVYPGAPEICDGKDNDGNGLTDDEDSGLDTSTASTWYFDGDSDGYGDAASSQLACELPDGYVNNDYDYDDTDDAVNILTWYRDADGDSYGDSTTTTTSDVTGSFSTPAGYSENAYDCDDGDASVNILTWYFDGDGDGYGDADDSTTSVIEGSCITPAGYVDNDYDYDDTNDSVNILTWYVDTDGDGYGDSTTTTTSDVTGSFSTPAGYSDNAYDCDDGDASVNILTWYFDGDGDGYGTPDNSTTSVIEGTCTMPADYVENDSDHADNDPTSYYGAPEVCDGADNDGDGLVDTDDPDIDLSTTSTFYADADGDGYGDVSNSQVACGQPDGYVGNDYDYDDGDDAVNILTWYEDADGDGYGTSATSTTSVVTGSFSTPSGYADNTDDCDDSSAAVSPAETEDYTNGIDDDCDGTIDDEDGDGYSILDGDCDDTNASVNPDTIDTSLDGVSENCSGNEEFFSEDIGISIVGDAGDDLGSEGTLADSNIDATGYSDLVMGIPDSSYNGASAGAVVVLLGDTASLPTAGTSSVYDSDLLWYGDNPGDQLGFPVGYGGNSSGNGYAGLLVGAQGANSVYLLDGDPSISTGTTGQSIGTSASVVFTGIVASAIASIDTGGDGIDEIFIGDETASSIYVYQGSGSGVDSSAPDFTLTGSADAAGHAIYPYRDVNADGYLDVLASAPEYDGTYTGSTLTDSGRVYLLFGPVSSGNLDDIANFIWEGDGASDELGENARLLADTYGDNLADILLTSANVAGTGSYEGAAYYFAGATAASDGTALASDADTTFWASSGDGLGSATTGHQADFTGDAYGEYCFGSPTNSDYAAASGQIYCVPGNTVSATSAYLDSLTGITRGYGSNADDYFGSSVLILDLNNDSTGEVAVGAPGSGSGGAVFLLTE